MKKLWAVIAIIFCACASFAQQGQTSDVSNTPPLYLGNAKYVQGLSPGYWTTCTNAGATALCSGLTLYVTKGTVWCQGTVRNYAGGTLAMTNNTTNYVYLDPAANCAPASSTTSFSALQVPIAVVVTSGGVITTITDDRSWITSLSFPNINGTLGCSQMPTLTGDVSNTNCATTVKALQGNAVSSTPPTDQYFLQWIAADSKWEPKPISLSGLGGTLACSQVPALTGDVTSAGGTCTTALSNIPDGTTQAGSVLHTNIAAPGTPASGKSKSYADSTLKLLCVINDAGTKSCTVVPDTSSTAHQFVTSIIGGVIARAQPGFSDLSGTATTSQLPGSGATTVNGVSCTLGGTCTVTAAPSGTAGGDLSGSYPNPTVVKVNGASVPASASVLGSNSSDQLIATVRGISFTIGDPAGSALSAASTTTDYVTVPFGCTLSAYDLLVDGGTITVKFWKIATGTAIPTSSNSINTSGVSISSGTAIHSTTLSDFTTTTITADDIVAMNVTTVATAKYVNGVLECK